VQPVPPAALELAQRLRQLRQQWPEARLTQDKLATAFSEEEKVAAATVSTWESLKTPKLPPAHRLTAYARFFATRRSVEGTPTLLAAAKLSADEKKVYQQLRAELLELRSATSGEPYEEETSFARSWHFPDSGRITFVCAQLPMDETGPFGKESNPNFTELQTYADIDALMELHGHIRAENPTANVRYRTPLDVETDELTGHLILLGGVAWNDLTGRLSEMANLPVKQIEKPPLKSGEIFIADIEGVEHEFWPEWMDGDTEVLAEDVGLLVRVPNPLNASRTLTICNGIHSRGVYGAARTLTDMEFRDGNERYIATKLGGADSFAILMSVKILKNKVMTPDFNSQGVVLYEWTGDVA
jgi:hypothetical protein